jgi:hypothetical protein
MINSETNNIDCDVCGADCGMDNAYGRGGWDRKHIWREVCPKCVAKYNLMSCPSCNDLFVIREDIDYSIAGHLCLRCMDMHFTYFENVARNLSRAHFYEGFFGCSDRPEGYYYLRLEDGRYQFRDTHLAVVAVVYPRKD